MIRKILFLLILTACSPQKAEKQYRYVDIRIYGPWDARVNPDIYEDPEQK